MMNLNKTEPQQLNSFEEVINKTVRTLDDGRAQLFAVSENARAEFSRLKERIAEIDSQVADINQELEAINEIENRSLAMLKKVKQNFEQHTENEIKDAFEHYKELQIESTRLLERRSQLLNKKTELEKNLETFRSTAEKAEHMVSQVGLVMGFISGNLKDINLKIESLQQRQQLSLQIIKAQEDERLRMARDIHDGPAQSMANVVFRVEFCEKLLDIEPDRVRKELKELKEVVKNNLQDVRKIIFDLRPMALDDLGLIPALKRYVDNFRAKNELDISLSILGKELRLDSALEIAVFRLVQEALNNVIKHAAATSVRLTLEISSDFVKAKIEDNGKGFDLSRVNQNPGNHYGLIGMRERIILLGGEMDINTQTGRGTRISFEIPVRIKDITSEEAL